MEKSLGLSRTRSVSHLPISQAIGSLPIAALILYAGILAGVGASVARDLGASYSFATEWETTRFTFSTSLGAVATLLDLIQKGCLLFLLIRAVLSPKNKHLILCLFALVGFAIYGSVGVLIDGVSLFEMLFGSVPLTMFLIPLFIVMAQDEVLVGCVRRFVPYVALAALVLALISILRFQIICGWGNTVGWCPARDLFALGISCLWVSVILSKENDCGYLFKSVLCLLALVVALMLAGRAWIIQSVLTLLIVSLSGSTASRGMRRLTFGICLAIGALLVISAFAPDVIGTFAERLNEDTRSGQYEVFFAQVDPMTLLLGNGSTAGYVYGKQSNYLFFDNQFLYLAFHYGIVPVLTLLFVLVRTIVSSKKGSFDQARAVACLYLMALVGLSNYYSFDMNGGIATLFLSFGAAVDRDPVDAAQERLRG